ncbi:ABC transporter ATP-binding protein [Kribbella albertanoniae]|uniref:ABC transporter ATP-binding protein n=1 Tax=Kribbella albertanoniae TaxID=1266829 RepID=A0A4R4Q1N2_9ACTN|nr:ABC transporter ATP-binding protein [Kribbella albertanoniae]TDC28719.1 ABC transporter ATP-binding protein [Kribbella albertanoniae]
MTTDRRSWRTLRGLGPAAALAFREAPAQLGLLSGIALVGAVLPVAVTWLTKLVIDSVTAGTAIDVLLPKAIALAVLGALTATLPQLSQYFSAEAQRRVSRAAKDRLYRAVNRFPGLGRFEDPQFLNQLQVAEAANSAPAQLTIAAMQLVRNVITALGLFASLYLISPLIAGIVLVAALPALLAELALARRRVNTTLRLSPDERRELFYQMLLSDARASKEIRLFGTGDFLRGRMMRTMSEIHVARRALDRRELFVQSGLELFAAVVAGTGLVWAILAAGRGELTAGDIALFVAAVAGVQVAMAGIVSLLAQANEQLMIFNHYTVVLGAPPELPVAEHPVATPELRRGIVFKDVWFRYGDDLPWVLRGVTVTIPYGMAVGLVGKNGAGKSTVVKLLCRMYDPTKGRITWDGIDLRDLDPARLRDRVGAVFQDFMSYDLTAAENIALGDLTALEDPDRIAAAAVQADIHEVVEKLPNGYRTMLSREFAEDDGSDGTGVVLSGGQWQRLALARAFLRADTDLMILDEPNAGLDPEAEAELHARISTLRAGGTSVLISHRLGTLRDADLIVVLDDGAVTETGTHTSLLAGGGTYARLFTTQAKGYQSE